MKHNHFSMLPTQAFQKRAFGGMTLEGGASSGGSGGPAGGGFLGRGAPANTVTADQFNSKRYLQQNPDVAEDPYYKAHPFQHFKDYGFDENRSPFEGFQYLPSQQQMYNSSYQRQSAPEMVTDAYQRILGRAPEAGNLNYWDRQMQQGLTGQGLVGGVTALPEFQRQQEYQRAYTEAFRPGYQEFGPSGQYYQPIYQSSYSQYQQPRGFYSPSYGGPSAFRNPFAYGGYGGGGYGGGYGGGFGSRFIGSSNYGGYEYEEGGSIKVGYDDEENAGIDEGIAGLLKK